MQNLNNYIEEQYLNNNNHPLTNFGQGNLPVAMPNNVSQPTIIRPENPRQKVEQAQTFEKPNPPQRNLRPQQNPIRRSNPVRVARPTSTAATPIAKPSKSKEDQIKEIYLEIDELKKRVKTPGSLTKIEKLLKQVLDASS